LPLELFHWERLGNGARLRGRRGIASLAPAAVIGPGAMHHLQILHGAGLLESAAVVLELELYCFCLLQSAGHLLASLITVWVTVPGFGIVSPTTHL
jgi:hypothetical protein